MAVRMASGVVAPAARVIGPVTELPSASSMAKVTSEPSVSGSVGVVMLREPYLAAGSGGPGGGEGERGAPLQLVLHAFSVPGRGAVARCRRQIAVDGGEEGVGGSSAGGEGHWPGY